MINLTSKKSIDNSHHNMKPKIVQPNFLTRILKTFSINGDNTPKLPESANQPYLSLSPSDSVEKGEYYEQALEWALENAKSKDIKNIALTGPYGSGKSSVLKTFVKNHKNSYKFLSVSLATFKEVKNSSESDEENKSNADIIRLIELSILQQIFYQEKDEKIPDSRFKKIKSFSRFTINLSSVGWVIFILSVSFLKYPELLKVITKNSVIDQTLELILRIFALVVSLSGIFFVVKKSIRTLSKIRLNKFNLFDTEIEVGDKIEKSILNQHIDEIIYFFEVTKYNVVIIEDLDRFNQTEIFTKLREINQILNLSKQINMNIVFIYAVRDDMFQDKQRSKFFDFIIPIIPVINSSNSSQKLIEYRNKNNFTWKIDLIEDLSLYINDLRLLNNIINEFYLYHKKQSQTLSQDKLLALLVYKNFFPEDFTNLGNGKGVLFNVLVEKRKEYIIELSYVIDEKIKGIENEIKRLSEIALVDVGELRAIYVFHLLKILNQFQSFYIKDSGIAVSVESIITDENFELLLNNNISYKRFNDSFTQYPIDKIFSAIESQIDTDRKYKDRENDIQNLKYGKINELKKEIKILQQQKRSLRSSKIKDLVYNSKINFNDISADHNQISLISVLVRNGYIGEDYPYYISIFYEGSLTKTDHDFIVSVNEQGQLDFNYNLTNTREIVKRLNENDFRNKYVFNLKLIDYLIASSDFEEKSNQVFVKLTDESKESIEFIDAMVENSTVLGQFVQRLVREWPGIWVFLENKSNFSEEHLYEYCTHIITYASIEDIIKINTESIFSDYILKNYDFLGTENDDNKLMSIISEFDLKFVSLWVENQRIFLPLAEISETNKKHLLNFILINRFYVLTTDMVVIFLKFFDTRSFNDLEFKFRNYKYMLNCEVLELKVSIEENINEYIENTYLKVGSYTEEEESEYIKLLTNPSLNSDLYEPLVRHVHKEISDLKLINNLELCDLLIKFNKVEATWKNVYSYYEISDAVINSDLIHFIGIKENVSRLSTQKLSVNSLSTEEDDFIFIQRFINELLQTSHFEDNVYCRLIESLTPIENVLSIDMLSEKKIECLIKSKVLSVSFDQFELIRNKRDRLGILFLETNKVAFLNGIVDYTMEPGDLLSVIASSNFTDYEKLKVISSVPFNFISDNPSLLKQIIPLLLNNTNFVFSKNHLLIILSSPHIKISDRIKLFNIKNSLLKHEDIDDFLTDLGEPYSLLTHKAKRPKLEVNELNEQLLAELKSLRYISNFDTNKGSFVISTFRK